MCDTNVVVFISFQHLLAVLDDNSSVFVSHFLSLQVVCRWLYFDWLSSWGGEVREVYGGRPFNVGIETDVAYHGCARGGCESEDGIAL